MNNNMRFASIKFACSHLFLFFQKYFMTDSMYFGTIYMCQNLNERYNYLILTIYVICQINANFSLLQWLGMLTSFSYQARTFKTNLLDLKSKFSKY